MPLFSLPSPYGIGTMGSAAKDFVDFLHAAGQRYWQMLPAGPTSYGDSPYQSFSSFAGNPYFVDIEILIDDGLLTKEEADSADLGQDPGKIDYGKLYENRIGLLKKAASRGMPDDGEALDAFIEEKKAWLPDYALFMALKRHYGMIPWTEWPDEDIRLHKPEACEKWNRVLREDVRFFEYIQLLFYRQWSKLRTYANDSGIGIIGDMPIYVAMDSADVWAKPQLFQLNDENLPEEVAGVPPDLFNADGQLWGNPLYDWEAMKQDGFDWWIRRIAGAGELFDVLRIDHFRGFESYYAVPASEKNARKGRWVKGPGAVFVDILKARFPDIDFIAEDLGYPTPEVKALLDGSGFPGMRLLECAFNETDDSDFLPHNYCVNCICYTGTHDNRTVKGWLDSAPEDELSFARNYLALNEEEGFARGVIRAGMSSVAGLFIAQMQDWLELGDEARINRPGIPEGNWTWRMKPGMATGKLAEEIYDMTRLYGRIS